MPTTIIPPKELLKNLNSPDWVIVDCRFSLFDTERGRRDYTSSHIPGAIYAHLDNDLSAPVIPGKTGRHPLPEVGVLAQKFSEWGIDESVQVVVYDDNVGAVAARLWWLLRFLGHEKAAVLDGGWKRWREENLPVTDEIPEIEPRKFIPEPRPELLVDAVEVEKVLDDPNYRLIDARSADRYSGENEPLDPAAGHIPGAVSAPYMENVDENGRMLPPDMLRERFRSLIGETDSERVISYCGSGITACHNLLALNHAGIGEAKLYAGSWSEWITDPDRPVKC